MNVFVAGAEAGAEGFARLLPSSRELDTQLARELLREEAETIWPVAAAKRGALARGNSVR